jgi:hypothetical protein
MYRYRYCGPTHLCEKRFDKILAKLGKIQYVRGYRYFGRYDTSHEAVLIRGENGTARFDGLLWGYGGQGPRGTHGLLLKMGVPADTAWKLAFETPRQNEIGEDWRYIPETSNVLS